MNWTTENILLAVSILLRLVAHFSNGICDGIKFSNRESAERYDNLWHWVKYIPDRFFLEVSGCLAFPTIIKSVRNGWQFEIEFVVYTFFFGASYYVFWFSKNFWQGYFKRHS